MTLESEEVSLESEEVSLRAPSGHLIRPGVSYTTSPQVDTPTPPPLPFQDTGPMVNTDV